MFAVIDVGGSQSSYVAGVFRDRKVPKVSKTSAIQPVGRENQPPEQQAHKGSSSFQNRLYEQVQAFLVFPWFRGQVGKEWSSGLWTFRAPQFIGKIYGSGLSVRPSPRKI